MTIPAGPQPSTDRARDVRAVLWEWDPNGVRKIGESWPADEYDDLIEPILLTLDSEPSLDELTEGIHSVIDAVYGLSSPHGCRAVAACLLALPR